MDNRTTTVIYPDYENVTEGFMRRIWKYDVKMDGVILQNTWPLDESLKNHNDTYDMLPYFNEVRVVTILFNSHYHWSLLQNSYGFFFNSLIVTKL